MDALELWCWRRLLRVPWTARRSNQSILQEISPGCSLEGLMLKLKLQYFGHFMRRVDSLEKTLMLGGGAGGEGDNRGWDGWMASLTRWAWVWVNCGSWWWTERPGMLQFMGTQRVGHDWATELNWTEDGWATCVCRIVSLKVCLYVCSGLTILIETVGFPGNSVVNCPSANAGNTRDVVLIPGSGKSPKEGNGTPLQYSCLENAMDRGGCRATVLGVHKKVRHYSMAKQ